MRKFLLSAIAFIAMSVNAQTLVAEKDWTGTEGSLLICEFGEPSVELVPEGIALTVNNPTENLWQTQEEVLEDFNLEINHTYKVVVVAKFPCDGDLQINMGNWGVNQQYVVPVTSTGDFQEVEVMFPDYAYDAEGSHVIFQCGGFLGTTIVKSVKVYDMTGGPSGIGIVKADENFDGAIYNLAGQKVNFSFKGVVIKNGKKFLQK